MLHILSSALELLRMVYLPGRKLIGLLITAVNRPEVLHDLTSFLVKHNMKPLYTNIASLNGNIEITIFLDISKTKTTINRVVKDISSLKDVKDVRVIKPLFKGLVIDNAHFPILLLGRRAWIIGEAMSKGLFRDVKVEFGEAGRVFLYHLGIEAGKSIYRSYKDYTTSDIEFLLLIKALVKAIGWGIVEEFKPLPDGTYVVRIYDNIECATCKPSKEPTGDFFRGIIAGLLLQLTGKTMLVEEVKCIAKGDSYCEFIAWPMSKNLY